MTRRVLTGLRDYLADLSAGRLMLWCYFVWYLVVLVRYFDPSPRLWLTSLGLSAIIGVALYVSTTASPNGPRRLAFWPTVRLFMMPFCVSSFSALVKDRGFVLIFSPDWRDLAIAGGVCAALCAAAALARRGERPTSAPVRSGEDDAGASSAGPSSARS